jgi:hypothetical protein
LPCEKSSSVCLLKIMLRQNDRVEIDSVGT